MSQASLPQTSPVTQALSDPLTSRLAFPIRVTVSLPSSLPPQTSSIRLLSSDLPPLCPPLRKGVRIELQSFQALALHPQVGASSCRFCLYLSMFSSSGHSEHMDLKTQTQRCWSQGWLWSQHPCEPQDTKTHRCRPQGWLWSQYPILYM